MSSQKVAWISLNDYSSKYKISISTLRRWIKQKKVSTHMLSGKYFVKDIDPKHNKIYDAGAKKTRHTKLTGKKEKQSFSHLKEESQGFPEQRKKSNMLAGKTFSFSTPNISFSEKGGEICGLKETFPKNNRLKGERMSVSSSLENVILRHEELKEQISPSMREKMTMEQIWGVMDQLLRLQSQFVECFFKRQSQWEDSMRQIQDLNTLVALLEEENRKCKSLQETEKNLNEWTIEK